MILYKHDKTENVAWFTSSGSEKRNTKQKGERLTWTLIASSMQPTWKPLTCLQFENVTSAHEAVSSIGIVFGALGENLIVGHQEVRRMREHTEGEVVAGGCTIWLHGDRNEVHLATSHVGIENTSYCTYIKTHNEYPLQQSTKLRAKAIGTGQTS